MKRRNIKQKIKEYFFIKPREKLRVREIERALKLPLPSVIRYCKELLEEDILKIIKTGNVVFYTGSRSENYLLEKKLYNIKKLYTSGLVEYLKTSLNNPVLVVFGSYCKGEDVEDSDIDLYIESFSNNKIKVEKFEKKLGRKIQIFKHKNIKDIKNKHLANNIVNGVVLNNYIEVFK